MKIIIISPSKNNRVGGVERFSWLLKEILEKEKFEVEIIGKEDIESSLIYKIFKKIPGINLAILGYLLGRFADKLNPGLVITNGLYGFSTKSKSINVEHGTFARASDRIDENNIFKKIIRKYLWGYFEKIALKKAQKVIAVSEETKESIEEYYKRKNAIVILNAVDINLFTKKDKLESKKLFNLPKDKKLILFVGRLSYEKSPEMIYELAKKFEKEDISFIFATDRILNWDLKNTIFLLNIPNEKLPYLYSACDVFILPSKHEGFAYTLIEAMACEMLFVISKVGGALEIYEKIPELRKFILDNLNTDEFYNKIKEVLEMRDLEKNKLSNLARKFVLENCSLEIWKEKWIKLINEIK
jgi:glycosyltransferase involved in cell wall biosynthesis